MDKDFAELKLGDSRDTLQTTFSLSDIYAQMVSLATLLTIDIAGLKEAPTSFRRREKLAKLSGAMKTTKRWQPEKSQALHRVRDTLVSAQNTE